MNGQMSKLTLGEKIKNLRKKLDMSQQQLASLAKIPQPTISRIENGDIKQPSPNHLKHIACVLHVSINELLDIPSPVTAQSITEQDNRAKYIFQGYERLSEDNKKKLLEFVKALEQQNKSQH